MILGIDIGGTSIKFGIVDNDYHIVHRCSIPTLPELGDTAIVQRIADMCSVLAVQFPFSKIGIGSPGTIDSEKGVCIVAGNLPYQNTPMVQMLMDTTKKAVTLSNDATCAICGELYAGVGQNYRSFVMITLGTGIGGGIIIDGKPFTGKKNLAGEFGHMTLVTNGLPCPACGRNGCYEKYASVTALIQQVNEAAAQYPTSILAQMCHDGVTGFSPFDAMKKGCSVAASVLDKYSAYIAAGIDNIQFTFDPDAIVIGGAISRQFDILSHLLKSHLTTQANVVFSPLQNDAGIIGAAILADNSPTPAAGL